MTIKKRAFNIYKEYYLRALILEIIARDGYLDAEKAAIYISHQINDKHEYEILWKTNVVDIDVTFQSLVTLGLVIQGKDYKTSILSEYGKEAMMSGTWHLAASNTWIGYKSLTMTQWALWISIGSFVIALMSLLIVVVGQGC